MTAADFDDTADASSDYQDSTSQHETLESGRDMAVGQDSTLGYHPLYHHREQHTAGNQQGEYLQGLRFTLLTSLLSPIMWK